MWSCFCRCLVFICICFYKIFIASKQKIFRQLKSRRILRETLCVSVGLAWKEEGKKEERFSLAPDKFLKFIAGKWAEERKTRERENHWRKRRDGETRSIITYQEKNIFPDHVWINKQLRTFLGWKNIKKSNTNNNGFCTSNSLTSGKTEQNRTAGEAKKERRKLLVMLPLAQEKKNRKKHSRHSPPQIYKKKIGLAYFAPRCSTFRNFWMKFAERLVFLTKLQSKESFQHCTRKVTWNKVFPTLINSSFPKFSFFFLATNYFELPLFKP